MAVIELTDGQVIDLVRQMPNERKREVLRLLAGNGFAQREHRQQIAETQLRHLAADRKLDWDKLSSAEREELIDDLIHEDRPCGL